MQEIPSREIPTQGIKYAGSKLKLLPHILSLIEKVKPRTVLDGFSGTTRVSQILARSGYTVFSNDLSVCSEVFARCFLENKKPVSYYEPMIEHLNALKPVEGWFTEHYGGEESRNLREISREPKKPFQKRNTMILDAIREEMDRMELPFAEKCVLLTSLILALDSVDSTLGHFASYLSEWSPRSYRPLKLECPRLFFSSPEKEHRIFRGDIFDLLPNINADLAYFDPPYGSNNEKMPPSRVRYAAYYHFWTTVCLNDRPPLFGKANRRKDSSDSVSGSVFEEFRRDENGHFLAVKAIRRLLQQVNSRYVLLSYNSNGKATAGELHEVIGEFGNLLEVLEIEHRKNIMSQMRWTNRWIKDAEKKNLEFLFLIEKKRTTYKPAA